MATKRKLLKAYIAAGYTARAIRRLMAKKGFNLSEYSDVDLTNLILKSRKSSSEVRL